jgi:hypothetical protein
MKPILDRTKSKAEACAASAAPKGTFQSPFSFRLFSWNFRDCLLWKAIRQAAAVRCALRPSKVAPAHRVFQPNLRGVYQGDDVRFGLKADMAVHSCDVRFTPKSGHCRE